MNAKTLKALKASIAHWKRFENGKQRQIEGTGSSSCALCHIYNKFLYDEGCGECPVKLKTGRNYCQKSPWQNAERARRKYGYGSPEFKAAAKKERLFLESLLPKRKRA